MRETSISKNQMQEGKEEDKEKEKESGKEAIFFAADCKHRANHITEYIETKKKRKKKQLPHVADGCKHRAKYRGYDEGHGYKLTCKNQLKEEQKSSWVSHG